MIKKFVKYLIILCILITNSLYSNSLELKLEYDFHLMLSKLNNETIQKDVKKANVNKVLETNGLVIHLDENNNIIEDVRDLYKNSPYAQYYAIAVNRKFMQLTIYRYNPKEFKYNIPLVSFPISCNYKKTPLGTHYTSDKYRWRQLFGNHWGQYCTRYSDKVLFHSVLYSSPSNATLESITYNGILYKIQSGGCIRLRTQDAKWIYDNVPYNSLVVVYDGFEESPFKRPIFEKISENQNFDPTDLEVVKESNFYGRK